MCCARLIRRIFAWSVLLQLQSLVSSSGGVSRIGLPYPVRGDLGHVVSLDEVRAPDWPRNEDGSLARCWNTTVLHDFQHGWRVECKTLSHVAAVSALFCRETCLRDPLCTVWQFDLVALCQHGRAHACADIHEDHMLDWLVSGAQQVQHGDVVPYAPVAPPASMKMLQVARFDANDTAAYGNCRSACYSNLYCGYWEFGSDGCFVEDPSGAPMPIPVHSEAGLLSREYLKHVCPSAPASTTSQDQQQESTVAYIFWWMTVAIACVGLLLGHLHLVNAYVQAEKGLGQCAMDEDDEDEEPSSDLDSEFATQSDHGRTYCWRLPLLPAMMFLQLKSPQEILAGSFVRKEEADQVWKKDHSASISLVSYLVWRRVTLAAIIAIGVGYWLLQLRVLVQNRADEVYFREIGARPHLGNYSAWVEAHPEIPGFLDYSTEKLSGLFSDLLADVFEGCVRATFVLLMLEGLALAALLAASRRWTSYWWSRRYALAAWGIAFATPLVVSMVPLQNLAYYNILPKVDAYVQELAVALHLDDAQQVLMHACDGVLDTDVDNAVDEFGTALRKACGIFSSFPVQMAVSCGPLSPTTICHADFWKTISQCKEAIHQLDIGNAKQASEMIQLTCSGVEQIFFPEAVDVEKGREQAFNLLLVMLKMPVHGVVVSIEYMTTTMNLFHVGLVTAPPTIMLMPAFVSAGITLKSLMPHSSLPGLLIIVSPVFFTAGAWLVSTGVFHYIGNPVFIVLSVIYLVGPVAFIVVGGIHRVGEPLPASMMRQVLPALRVILWSVFLVNLIVGSVMLYKMKRLRDDAAPYSPGLLHVRWNTLIASCVMSAAYFYVMTTFGVIDWLMLDIAKEHAYWSRSFQGGSISALKPLESVSQRSALSDQSHGKLAELFVYRRAVGDGFPSDSARGE